MKLKVKATLATLAAMTIGVTTYAGFTYIASMPPSPTIADIPYGNNTAERFDLWEPRGKGPFPVVLTVHGGAFLFGDKRGHDGLKQDIAALLAHGIAVASTNYRMSNEAVFPAAAQDVAAALVELHRRAPALNLDPNRIALWGKSAGGNLALLAGLANGRRPIGAGNGVAVAGIVAMYPPVQFDLMDTQLRASACGEKAATHDAAGSPESQWLGGPLLSRRAAVAAANPITYADASAPPVLLQAGSADCMIPHQQSLILAAALRRAGTPVRLNIVSGAKHIDPLFDAPANLAVVVAFLQSVFSHGPASATAQHLALGRRDATS